MPLATTIVAVPAPAVDVAIPETKAAVAMCDAAVFVSDPAVANPDLSDAATPTSYDIECSFKGKSKYTHHRLLLIAYTALIEKGVDTWPQARLARNICVALAALNLDAPIAKGMCVGSCCHIR